MSHPCPVEHCPRPAPGDQTVCRACQAELRRALDAVPEVVRELHTTLSRQTSRTTGGRPSETPLPYDARASEAAWVLRNALVGWVRVLMEAIVPHAGPTCRRCEHPSCGVARYSQGPRDTCPSMAAWLSAGLSRLVRHPVAEEAHGEIVAAVRAAERVVDRPAERRFAGRCPGCGSALYGKPGAGTVQCRAEDCDADPVDVAVQWDAMLDQMQDQLVTAAQASDILTRLAAPLKAELVRQWGSRGRLVAHGRDLAGHPLYRVSDVRDLLVEKLAREAKASAKRETKQRERMSA